MRATETKVLEQEGWGDCSVLGIRLVVCVGGMEGTLSQGHLIGGCRGGYQMVVLSLSLSHCVSCIFPASLKALGPGVGLGLSGPK